MTSTVANGIDPTLNKSDTDIALKSNQCNFHSLQSYICVHLAPVSQGLSISVSLESAREWWSAEQSHSIPAAGPG